MPTGNMQLDCGTLYYKSNGEHKKLCNTAFFETAVIDFDEESPLWETMPFLAPELMLKCTVQLPWYKNIHLAKYGKNRRIRNKNAIMVQKAVQHFFFGM